MKKEKLLLVLTSMAFLLLFGAVSSHAQGTLVGYQATLDAQDYDVSGVNFTNPNSAVETLKAELALLEAADPSNMTEVEEANHGVRMSYYPHLIEQVQVHNDVSVALPSSAGFLVARVDNYKPLLGINAQDIYQETVTLLSN